MALLVLTTCLERRGSCWTKDYMERFWPENLCDLEKQGALLNPAEKVDFFLFPHFPAEFFIHPLVCSS